MFKTVLLLGAIVLSASGQILVQPAVSFYKIKDVKFSVLKKHVSNQQVHLAHPELAHPAVLASQAWEHQLPPELLKSAKFYENPRTAEHLAAASWFGPEENPVFARKAEEIDRSAINKIFRNSGLQKKK